MKFVDSRKEQLDYGQILHAYHSNIAHKDERIKDFNVWMLTLAGTLAKNKMDGALIGNTVFYYRRGSGEKSNMATVWALNVDTMQNAANSLAEFANRMAAEGIDILVSIYDSPAMSRVIRQAYQKIQSPGDELTISKLPSGNYVMQLVMGEAANV